MRLITLMELPLVPLTLFAESFSDRVGRVSDGDKVLPTNKNQKISNYLGLKVDYEQQENIFVNSLKTYEF